MNIQKMKPVLVSSNVMPLFNDTNRFADINIAALNESEQKSLVDMALEVLSLRHQKGVEIKSPDATKEYLRLLIGDASNEHFGVIFLDTKHRLISNEVLFNGTISSASVYPRVIVKYALDCNASAVILYHNHPSGKAEPSHADQHITTRIRSALELIDVRVLDHLVVSAQDYVSFADRGLI